MKRNILFYPTIDIPNETWLRNAIIYWDELSSITPMISRDIPVKSFSGNIQYLKDEGIYRPINPNILLNSSNLTSIESFKTEFTDIIDSRDFQRIRVPNERFSNIHREKIETPDSEIHQDKVSYGLLQILENRGLIKNETIDSEWINVDSKTALLYMSLLAKYIAEIDKEATTIGTDNYTYEKLNFTKNRNDNISFLNTGLNNVLPTPVSNVPFEKIIKFKNKRKNELLKFRNEITKFENSLSKSESIKEMKHHMVEFSERIEIEVNELNKIFKDSKILTIANSLKSLISIKSPTLLVSLAVYAGKASQIANLPIDNTIIGLAVMGSIELGHSYINSRNTRLTTERDSSFSYLYHAEQRGIIRRTPHNTI